MSMYAEKHKLYSNYCHELDRYRNYPLSTSEADINQWCDDYINNRDCSWKNIFDETEEKLVGFLIVGKAGSEKHPDAAYGIAQAYVAPEYRGMGLMTKAVNDYLDRHKGIYCLLVIKNNSYAFDFWHKTFGNAGYHSCQLDNSCVIDNGDDLCLLGFAPNN